MTRLRASFLLAFVAAIVAAGGADDRAAALEPRIRSVYVTALNASGAPVTDLTAAEFTVKEGGREEHSTLPAHHVLDQLRQSGASLHVVAVKGGGLRTPVAATKPSALLESNLNLSEVLGDGPKQSGGHRDEIVAAAGIATDLEQLAES